jgi:hypothetical protein
MSDQDLVAEGVLRAAMNAAGMGRMPADHDGSACGCGGNLGDHWAMHVMTRVQERGFRMVPDPETRLVTRAAIVSDPYTLGGSPRFDGTRLGIDTILGWLTGAVPGAVEEAFPHLPPGWYRLLVALRPFLRREFREAVKGPERRVSDDPLIPQWEERRGKP